MAGRFLYLSGDPVVPEAVRRFQDRQPGSEMTRFGTAAEIEMAIDRGVVEVAVALSGWADDTDAVRLTASAQGKKIASTIIRANRRTTLSIPDAHLWSPDDPYLYDLKAELVTVRDPYAGEEERNRKAYDSRFTEYESEVYADAQVTGAPRDSVDARL